MEYMPRYPQPFTIAQAVLLDVPTISEEISRIHNSLEHLKRTQAELLEALAVDPNDPDFRKAHEENEDVIGSQAERISMLQMALVEKGISVASHHYDLADARPPRATEDAARRRAAPAPPPPAAPAAEDDEGGIDL